MLETGVPNLDLVLGGGIPEGDVLLVTGPAGSGKTTLGFQMACHAARKGLKVLYVSTLSEAPAVLVRHMRGFSFFDEGFISRSIFLLSLYPLVKDDLQKVTATLVQAVRDRGAGLVVLDGLTTVRDLHPEAPALRIFIYELSSALAAERCTNVLTSSSLESAAVHPSPEFTVADGLVEMGIQYMEGRVERTLRVGKLRGQAPILGFHSLRLDRDGIAVYPRLEAVSQPQQVGLSRERRSIGLRELDQMMQGGLPSGSIALLAGSAGTGKTLVCLQFLLEGARRGEKGLFIGFRESPEQLYDKARQFGLDLETPIRDGRLRIMQRRLAGLLADEVGWELRREVESFSPVRLALDGVAHLEWAVPGGRRQEYMEALAGLLRAAGVTSVITKEISQLVGPELDFADTPMAFLAETLLLMRYVELRGELHRIISILKMRDSDHDRSIRLYAIGADGLRVLEPLDGAEGVLTGVARLPSEKRVKRSPGG